MTARRRWLAIGLAMMAGCAVSTADGRFKDQPIVWQVDDARHIPEPTYRAHSTVFSKIADVVEPPARKVAQNTNALDEVPDSTWFTNRIGLRPLTADQVLAGPNVSGEPQRPITIVEGKIEGATPGFLIDDSRGIRYLVKLDTPANPEQQTAAGLIVNRLFWALGYNVPSDHLFFFRREELRLAPNIVYRDPNSGETVRLDWARVDQILAGATRRPDGLYRVLVSELLAGKRKGGWSDVGTRRDDPNDRVPHQYRRELRGLRVFAAWLGHTDVTQSNTLDMYVDWDGRRFLRHYLVDFGGALGGQQSEFGRPEVGWEYSFDLTSQAVATVTFGTQTKTWERQKKTPWKAVGYFSSRYYDPTRWREFSPYEPFKNMDRADAYWAAKTIMKVERPLIRALVDAAQYSEPGAADYMVDTLMQRRDQTARAFLDIVTPLDEFRFVGRQLCTTDLAVKYGFADQGVIERRDVVDRVIARHPVGPGGRVCFPLARTDVYSVLRLRVLRRGSPRPGMQIHYKGGARPRILGVIRVE